MTNIAVELGKLSTSLGVQAAYGESRDVGGASMVPVALVWSGFGGGSDSSEQRDGGGGGSVSIPVGSYVSRDGDLRFEPNLVCLLAVSIPVVWVGGRALSRVIRAFKK